MSTSISVKSPSPTVIVEPLARRAVQIRLNRPESLNARSVELVQTLRNVVEEAIASGASALIFRGAGRAFCSGADLKERRKMTAKEQYEHNRAINRAVNAVADAPVPTIAIVHGPAVGGGLELALACDVRMAAEDAQIGLTETRLGAIPGAGGSQRLPRLVGISQALFMMYAGDPIDGKRAREIGLVNYCAPRSKLENVAAEYIATLTSRSSATAQTLKRVVHRGMQMPLADALEYERQALLSIFGSPDYAEGLAAFAEKRAPRFLL